MACVSEGICAQPRTSCLHSVFGTLCHSQCLHITQNSPLVATAVCMCILTCHIFLDLFSYCYCDLCSHISQLPCEGVHLALFPLLSLRTAIFVCFWTCKDCAFRLSFASVLAAILLCHHRLTITTECRAYYSQD